MKDLASVRSDYIDVAGNEGRLIDYVDIGSVETGRLKHTPEQYVLKNAPSRARQRVHDGDVIISMVRTYLRSILRISKGLQHCVVSTGFAVLRPRPHVESRWLAYALQRSEFMNDVVRHSTGMSYPSISSKRLMALPMTALEIGEQRLVVRYLDNAELRIGRAIQAKQSLLDRLDELTSAKRWHSLTGGTDSESHLIEGAEWMGAVPSDFQPARFKAVLTERTVRSGTGRQPLLSLRMREGLVKSSDFSARPEDADKLAHYKLVEPGQLVMNRMRASIGVFGVADVHGIVSPDYATFDVSESLHPGFMLLLLKSAQCGSLIRANSRGMGTGHSGFLRIYTDAFGRLVAAVPPKWEQARRYQAAVDATEGLAAAIEALQQEINLLSEYRTKLISDVVAGKKDIRAEAASMKDVDPAELAAALAGGTPSDDTDLEVNEDAE